uniref:Putative secreted protein salivary gland overexpressed n=1 Tax=Rhipicephalus microplus TaxID=6941 RepID=A0A6M2DB77_RHIMP
MNAAAWKVIGLFTTVVLFSLLAAEAESVTCDQVDEATCQSIVDPNGSLCECCPTCMKLRDSGSPFIVPFVGRRTPRA